MSDKHEAIRELTKLLELESALNAAVARWVQGTTCPQCGQRFAGIDAMEASVQATHAKLMANINAARAYWQRIGGG